MKRFALLAVLALLSLVGCGNRDSRPNLVLVVLDTTRADRLSVYGHDKPTTPYLEDFAEKGVRFDRAWSVSSWTLPSHASMFTGVMPAIHGADQEHYKIRSVIPTLAEILSESGYQTAGFTNNPWVSSQKGDLDRGFEHFENIWANRKERKLWAMGNHPTVWAVKKWSMLTAKRSQPFFAFINLIEPHLSYKPPKEEGQIFFKDEQAYERAMRASPRASRVMARHYQRRKPLEKSLIAIMKRLYDGELRRVDTVAGQIIDALQRAGGAENTIVIVTDDHGVHHVEYGHLGHVYSLS